MAVVLLAACQTGTVRQTGMDLSHIRAFVPAEGQRYHADSINGYATFSQENNVLIIPEEITKEQYDALLSDKNVFRSEAVNPHSTRYAEIDHKTRNNIVRYDSLRGNHPLFDELIQERRQDAVSEISQVIHYPEIKQYECQIYAPLTIESFIMTEDGIIDSTFMQASNSSSYGKNRIFVGQEGHDCDFHGSLWFYWYDEKSRHMVPICHYKDYRWNEDTSDFSLCWISDDELLVSAVSNGNDFFGAGGYKPKALAPYGTPVYYKLRLTLSN